MTGDLETIYADTTAWIRYDFKDTDLQPLLIYRRCKCGRYLKEGKLSVNYAESVKLTGWLCKKCGEVEPYYDWVDK